MLYVTKIINITLPNDEERDLVILTMREFFIPVLKQANITWTECKPQKICFPREHCPPFLAWLQKNLVDKQMLLLRNASLIKGLGIGEISENTLIVTTILFIGVSIISSIPVLLHQINPYFRVLKNKCLQIFQKKKKVVNIKNIEY